MNDKIVDIYYYDDFEDNDFNEAISDLKQFGVNEDELNLNYREDLFE
jgi:uncharacterized membrane protein